MKYEEIKKFDNLKNNYLINSILWFNGIKTIDDLKMLEQSDFPYRFNFADEFIAAINKCKNNNKKIVIIGDYDCDGVCATSILKIFLDALKIDNDFIIGDRVTDGYGMNNSLIDKAKQMNASLIITVDNGIKCKDEVIYAKSLGIDVIITDHHLPEDDYIPNCLIFNPHYKNDHLIFKDICGAFVITALIYDYLKSPNALIKSSKELMFELYELAALATIADLMPLYYFNRKLVIQLYKNINNSSIYNYGLKLLIETLLASNEITLPIVDDSLSFKVVPIINAPGRLKHASILVDLFTNPNSDIIDECLKINQKRKLESSIALSKLTIEDTNINVLFDDTIPEGILGIVASQIKEKTNKPTLVFTTGHNGTIKGSGRSIDGFHLLNALIDVFNRFDLALYYGGHEKALGLTLKDISAYKEFKQRVSNMPYETTEVIKYYIEANNYPSTIYNAVDSLKPYGQGFEKPLFHVKGFPINHKILKERHSSFQIINNNITYNFIYFNHIIENKELDVYFTVSRENFNNKEYYKCYVENAV